MKRLGTGTLLHLALGLLVVAMIALAGGIAMKSIMILAVVALLIGAGQGISNLSAFQLIHKRVDPHQVTSATSLLSLGTYLAAAAVPLTGGVLADTHGMAFSGYGMATAIVVMCLIGSFFISEKFMGEAGGSA